MAVGEFGRESMFVQIICLIIQNNTSPINLEKNHLPNL